MSGTAVRLPDGTLDIKEDPVCEQANPYTGLNWEPVICADDCHHTRRRFGYVRGNHCIITFNITPNGESVGCALGMEPNGTINKATAHWNHMGPWILFVCQTASCWTVISIPVLLALLSSRKGRDGFQVPGCCCTLLMPPSQVPQIETSCCGGHHVIFLNHPFYD
jgi:hypothetical protein